MPVRIPHSRPRFGPKFSEAVARVLKSGQLAAGPECRALECEAAGIVGVAHAAAVDSGTSALMLTLYALKAEHDDIRRVGIPAYACSAVLHAVRAAGVEPVCMDCGDDLRLQPARALETAAGLDAVVLVHPFGMIEPMVREKWPCPLIEDIAQSAGGNLDGRQLGSFGDISIASFYATKPWGGACGGLVMSRDGQIPRLVCRMRCAETADISLPYVGNHLLSDVHASLARVRISTAPDVRMHRMRLAQTYDEWFTELKATPVGREASCAHYRYIVRVDDAAGAIEALRGRGVGAARPVETPLSSLMKQACEGAEAAWRQCVSLPLLADMHEEEVAMMHAAVTACL